MKLLRLRYAAVCSICGLALKPGASAYWNSDTKEVVCRGCVGEVQTPSDPRGTPGASALAMAHILEDRAVERVEKQWGHQAALAAAKIVEDDPSVRAWKKGAGGESQLAAFIDRELGDSVIGLHDRLIPGTRASNIDHIFVAPTGIWIVDAKAYKGTVERRGRRVYVNGRDRSKLVDGLALQVKAVRASLELDPVLSGVNLFRVICFIGSMWPRFSRPFEVQGVFIARPRALRDQLRKRGGLTEEMRLNIASRLEQSLPPANS